MVNFRSRNSRAAANTAVGLLLLQLGLRGLAIFLNEQGGNTYDVAGDINGPGYWWLLVPESWTIDIVTRFSFWLLLPLGLFFLVRAGLVVKSAVTLATRISIGLLLILAAWIFLIGSWGVIIAAVHASPTWSPPEVIFPAILYLFIAKIWPLFFVAAALCGYSAFRLRKRLKTTMKV